MFLQLVMHFCTDGDFDFGNLFEVFDSGNSMYAGAMIHYHCDEDNGVIHISLRADGDANACRWAARDLMESLVCSIRTHKYYLIRDVYNLIITPKEDLLWSGKFVNHHGILGGNYDGTYLDLGITALDD